MTRLLDRIAPHAEAWLCDHEDGGQARRHGSDTVLKTLAALDAALVGTDRRRGPAERLERKGPDCSVFAMGAGVQAVVAREGRARLVASVRQAEVANVLAIWTALFGAPGQGAPIAE